MIEPYRCLWRKATANNATAYYPIWIHSAPLNGTVDASAWQEPYSFRVRVEELVAEE